MFRYIIYIGAFNSVLGIPTLRILKHFCSSSLYFSSTLSSISSSFIFLSKTEWQEKWLFIYSKISSRNLFFSWAVYFCSEIDCKIVLWRILFNNFSHMWHNAWPLNIFSPFCLIDETFLLFYGFLSENSPKYVLPLCMDAQNWFEFYQFLGCSGRHIVQSDQFLFKKRIFSNIRNFWQT